jgi:hypothetical protein
LILRFSPGAAIYISYYEWTVSRRQGGNPPAARLDLTNWSKQRYQGVVICQVFRTHFVEMIKKMMRATVFHGIGQFLCER